MVEIKNLVKRYGEKVVFDGLSITFKDKKVTAILGNSGIGKTTLLNVIARLTDFDGDVLLSSKGISYVFQSPRLIDTLTVLQNVEYVLTTDYPDNGERKKVARENLKKAEIDHLENKFPSEISGGEKQRVQLARAFSKPSELLIMDEPFSSLDISLKSRLMKLYISFLKENPKTVIFVTHDPFEALSFADDIVILQDGGYKRFEVLSEKENRDLESDEISNLRKEIYNVLT